MTRIFGVLALMGLSACTMGYWPKVEGTVDQSRYQADVRECQTDSQGAGGNAAYLLGGIAGQALAADSDAQKTAINACMAKRGYHVVS